ncbi:LamG domain-containing protein [Phycisphaerales bacterium AB-hyl4]|uniref:LamG domain-containing protein n=1 Tax=Natronomicrosphaera hydrolytica TaxID=3242702 RepID=A0ABV4U7K2_9BACT
MNTMLKSLGCAAVVAGAGMGANVAQADYVSTVLSNEDLIAYYRLGEDPSQTSTATDASGSHDGTYHGSPLSTMGPTADDGWNSFGDNNSAINLNGAGAITLDTAALDIPQITFTGWFRLTDDTHNQRIYTTQASPSNRFTINVANGQRLHVTTGGSNGAWVPIDTVLDGEWHHLVVSRGSNAREDVAVWIDFLPVATTLASHFGQGTGTNPTLGAQGVVDGTIDNSFLGSLDEVAFFNRVFTQEDVNELHAAALIPEPASLALLGLGGLAMLGRRRRA